MLQTLSIWRFTTVAALATPFALGAPAALAQVDKPDDYPTRPIELVVPFGAGGGNDLTARAIASVAPDYLGQPLIVRIRPGAGTVLGLSEVAKARADGYTLALPGPHSLTTGEFREIPIDLLEEFVPVAGVTNWPFMLLAPADSPFDSFEEMMEHAKANPGDLSIGNAGSLTIAHLPALVLEGEAGIELTHVPFDGGGPLQTALNNGDVDLGWGIPAWAVPAVQDGRLKLLAVAGRDRLEAFPDVPTLKELGYNIEVALAIGIVAPKGIPEDRLNFLRAAFAELVKDPTYNTIVERMGDKVVYWEPDDFWDHWQEVRDQSAAAAKRLKELGLVQ